MHVPLVYHTEEKNRSKREKKEIYLCVKITTPLQFQSASGVYYYMHADFSRLPKNKMK